jgi:hypothetical protein
LPQTCRLLCFEILFPYFIMSLRDEINLESKTNFEPLLASSVNRGNNAARKGKIVRGLLELILRIDQRSGEHVHPLKGMCLAAEWRMSVLYAYREGTPL